MRWAWARRWSSSVQGPIGCLHAQIAKLHGATTIIMADLNRERLNKCHSFGGTHFVVSSEEDLVARGDGDYRRPGRGRALWRPPPPPSPTSRVWSCCARRAGSSLSAAWPRRIHGPPWTETLIHYKRLRIFGAYFLLRRRLRQGVRAAEGGRIDTAIITHQLP